LFQNSGDQNPLEAAKNRTELDRSIISVSAA